jgi:hypothetical protein
LVVTSFSISAKTSLPTQPTNFGTSAIPYDIQEAHRIVLRADPPGTLV